MKIIDVRDRLPIMMPGAMVFARTMQALALSLFGGTALMFFIAPEFGFGWFLLNLVIFYPLWLLSAKLWSSIATDPFKDRVKAIAIACLSELAGGKLDHSDVETVFAKGYAITSAIGQKNGIIYVLDRGFVAEISWDNIRRWEWNVEAADQIVMIGGTLGDRISDTGGEVAQLNARAREAAQAASGFTVTAANIDNPTWRFGTSDANKCKRWMEIFSQIKEGRIGRVAPQQVAA